MGVFVCGFPSDVPVGEKRTEEGRSPGRDKGRSGLTERDREEGERWFDREHPDRDGSPHEDRGAGGTVHSRFQDKDITDLKMVWLMASAACFCVCTHCS
jgi:hypothetical protein